MSLTIKDDRGTPRQCCVNLGLTLTFQFNIHKNLNHNFTIEPQIFFISKI